MNCEHYSLGENPFNFDIKWAFPADERRALVDTIGEINISSPAGIGELEEKLNEKLSSRGYFWDQEHRGKCRLWRPDFNMSVDFYNESKKIAIEVEKSEVKRIIHDFLKLINGSLTFVPKVRFGVIIHPKAYKRTSGKESPFSSRVFSEVNFYFKHLINQTMLNDVLFLIYDF